MSTNRPFTLSIAGFDPSAGAGVLADIKTFEQHQVYGLAINTANTIQTENNFLAIDWTRIDFILQSIETLFRTYNIKAVKIGVVSSLENLTQIVSLIKNISPETKIVWDTVLKSTTEFDFLSIKNQKVLIAILDKIEVITPNYNEILKLNTSENSAEKIAKKLSQHCNVFLKGGHHPTEKGTDYLYLKNEIINLTPKNTTIFPKHGSGCVLSAAITANLSLDQDLLLACQNAKKYTENFLSSTPSQLGHHYV
ncbi:hydroxymethylpyrimidine/phosphomethylpyrimidine kinase [Flavobacterium chuncheonense]|uniref:hydroxymethylpyrimidine kinase n=1 Tax=Flavobacterium chuncheonense TaxID=2026653 RepID=A0ABW5YN39_9FLAO